MKKLIKLVTIMILFLLFAAPALSAPKKATYMEWFWNNPETPGEGYKSAYFMKTGSGIVQGFTYEHPDLGNSKWIFKPLSKFKNATECDEGWLRENPNWNPQNLHNAMYPEFKPLFWDIFNPGFYLFCAYPME